MLVPALVVKLDEAHAALTESAREQAVGRIRAWSFGVLTIHLVNMLWLILHVGDLRNGSLHAEGHLILGDTVFELKVSAFSKLSLMKIAQPVEHQAPAFGALASRVIEVEHRVLFRTEAHTVMLAR